MPASATDVMSLMSARFMPAPSRISSTPSVDAFARACMRASGSAKRTTPTAEIRTNTAPASASRSPRRIGGEVLPRVHERQHTDPGHDQCHRGGHGIEAKVHGQTEIADPRCVFGHELIIDDEAEFRADPHNGNGRSDCRDEERNASYPATDRDQEHPDYREQCKGRDQRITRLPHRKMAQRQVRVASAVRTRQASRPWRTVRSRIPSVARRAESGTIGKRSLRSPVTFDQS